MKKGIIVLLIAVLISGFAFAGTFTGSAGIQFGVDLDDHDWGFANSKSGKYSFSFEFDTTKVAIGEDHQTDIWAELAAEASLKVSGSNQPLSSGTEIAPKYIAKITKANIHVGEITFGILNSGSAVDYAASYYDDDEDGDPDYDLLGGESSLAPGFTVTYKGWYGGFGVSGDWNAEGNADDNTSAMWGHAKTQSFELADGLTAEAGGYAVLSKGADRYIGGGLKADYKQDKLSAGIGGDGALKKGDVDFGVEGSIYAEYAFAEEGTVRLDVYGVSKGYLQLLGAEELKGLKLDAMASASYKFNFSEDIALDVTGLVDVRNILDKNMFITVGAEEKTSVDAFDFYASEVLLALGLADKELDPWFALVLDFKATYNHDKFTAWAELEPGFLFDAVDTTDTFSALEFSCGASSDAIIEGAVLKVVYADADLLAFKDNRGNITASCTITF